MYHGVSRNNYNPPVWTQLSEEIFLTQIQFLKAHYKMLTLSQFLNTLNSPETFPERTALITFDDGLRNNYSIVYPILKEYSIPAAIFLTVNFIETDKILWFDELFLLLRKALSQEFPLSKFDFIDEKNLSIQNLSRIYLSTVEKFKKMSEPERNNYMKELKKYFNLHNKEMEDFRMLKWSQVAEMRQSGLVDFGVHSANHKILSTLTPGEWSGEIQEPKQKLSDILGCEIRSFCYPNGRPEVDFNEGHIDFLRECGYVTAFSTKPSLYCPVTGDVFQICRIPVGNDLTSHKSFFSLMTSGFWKLAQ